METVVQSANESLWEIKGKIDYVDEWVFMRTPIPIFAIWLAYITFVLKLGPAYMKGRPPFQLRNIIVAYNIAQVLISIYLFLTGFKIFWKNRLINHICISDYEDLQRHVISNFYYYFLAKISELLDTVFFVLRKRYRQVSFLHVYHHSITVLFTWFIIKFDPSDITIFLGTINSFVHIIMYGYYALSAFPRLAKYLWWKVYITKLQLVQFMIILVQATIDYKYSKCDTTFILMGLIYFNLILMIILFSNFYIQSYLKNNSKISKVTKKSEKEKRYIKEDHLNGKHDKNNGVHTNGKHNGTEKRKENNNISGIVNGSHSKKTQ